MSFSVTGPYLSILQRNMGRQVKTNVFTKISDIVDHHILIGWS